MNDDQWRLLNDDCVLALLEMPAGMADLAFADPPFNIGYEYDYYRDNRPPNEYLAWCERWGRLLVASLKLTGSLWLAIGDEYASDLDLLFRRDLGLHRRSWVIWHYTFGVNCTRKFTPSHTHLFHYVLDPDHFTFNADAVKVPSAREIVYGDRRAKKGGRLPDDVWVLRPQQCEEAFKPEADTWAISRVCGTFKERTGHPCQMPEAALERIIRVSSNPGELVIDPFAGSGTTLAVATRLGRRSIGIEMSPNYCEAIRQRLQQQERR